MNEDNVFLQHVGNHTTSHPSQMTGIPKQHHLVSSTYNLQYTHTQAFQYNWSQCSSIDIKICVQLRNSANRTL